jgi:hypothetical protein
MSLSKWIRKFFGPDGGDLETTTSPKVPSPQRNLSGEDLLLRLIEEDSLDSCIKVYINAESGKALESRAMDKIKKMARSLDDWRMISLKVSPSSPLGIFASEQLLLAAKTFKDWQMLYETVTDNETKVNALNKMAELADSWEEKLIVYRMAAEGSSLKNSFSALLKTQIKSREDWIRVAEASDGELEKISIEKAIELSAGNLNNLCTILSHDKVSSDDSLSEQVLNLVRELKMSADEWAGVINDEYYHPEKVKKIALEMLLASPELAGKGFTGWKAILEAAEEGGDLEKQAAKMTVAQAPVDDPEVLVDLLRISAIENDDELKEAVLEKLRIVSPTFFDKWKTLYENEEEEDIKKIALNKMIEGIDSIERLLEVDNLVSEDDEDEFEKLVLPKAKLVLVTKEVCRRIMEEYHAEGPLFETAFEFLLDQAEDTHQCFDLVTSLLNDWKDMNDDCNEDLLNKTISKLLTVATPTEVYIMSKLDGEYEELASEAAKKLED